MGKYRLIEDLQMMPNEVILLDIKFERNLIVLLSVSFQKVDISVRNIIILHRMNKIKGKYRNRWSIRIFHQIESSNSILFKFE